MVSFEEFIASCESQIAPLVKEALEEYRRYLEYNWLKLRDGDEIEVSLDYPHDVVKEVARLWNEGTGWTATSKGLFTLVFRGQGAHHPRLKMQLLASKNLLRNVATNSKPNSRRRSIASSI